MRALLGTHTLLSIGKAKDNKCMYEPRQYLLLLSMVFLHQQRSEQTTYHLLIAGGGCGIMSEPVTHAPG